MVQANSISTLASTQLRRLTVDHRPVHDGAHGGRDPRRHQVDRARLRAAGAVHGDLLRRRLPDHPRTSTPTCAARRSRCIVTSAFTPARRRRRLPRRRRPRGDALRRRARPLLERVGARQRADRRGRGADQEPVRQALVSSTGTFWDTVVVCLMTGLVVVTASWRSRAGPRGRRLTAGAFHRRCRVRPDRADDRPADLRLLDDPRLGLLRREGGGVPLRHGVDPALSLALGRRRHGGLGRAAAASCGTSPTSRTG